MKQMFFASSGQTIEATGNLQARWDSMRPMSDTTGNPQPEQPRNPKAEAKAGKAYAKASRPWYKKKRWWLAGLVIVGIIAAVSGGGGNETPTATDTPKASDTPKAKPVAVKAATIIKEFEDNELAADAKYKGKMLKVTGVVDKIDAEFLDEDQYVLRLGGGSDFELVTVNCNDMSTEELSTINKGDSVTVIGEFDDGGDLGVEVKDCKLA